jgi:MEDS: MEthanogen/methylotroph, DcmR Sensory domain
VGGGFNTDPQTGILWGAMAPHEHIVQFYGSDDTLLENLTSFVVSGLNRGEGVIVVLTSDHLRALNCILSEGDVDIEGAAADDRYITIDVESVIASLMVKGLPDEQRFADFSDLLLRRAGANFRRVRLFGETVAVLWERGQAAAVVRLEQMWQQFCSANWLSVYCAYPTAEFTEAHREPLAEICMAHTRVLSAPAGCCD